jgi:hypothetical protein
MASGSPDPVQLRCTRQELVDGMPSRANWPRPDRASFFTKDREGRELEDRYLATWGALDDYVDGKKELDIVNARPLARLTRGQLYRLLRRALEHNPRTGAINGYWACVPGWSAKVAPDDPAASPYGKELRKFFDQHPDIEADLCIFCFPDGKKSEVPLRHLTAGKVHDHFTMLCRAQGLHEASPKQWPYVRQEVDQETGVRRTVDTTTVGKEAVRRWWKKQCFLRPAEAAYRVMPSDKAALFKRDHARLNENQAVRPRGYDLFERWELDENKLNAQWTMLLPMLNGKFQEVITRRLWGLSVVDCSVFLRMASCVSHSPRYRTQDIKRLLYRAAFPPARPKLTLEHAEYRYHEGAAYGLEPSVFSGSMCKTLCLDNDSTHLAEDTLESIRDTFRCSIVNGLVGVPEKHAFVERLFVAWSTAMSMLPSATGTGIDDPARQHDAQEAAVRYRITWWLAEEILDVLCRNWNVTPMLALGGVSPLHAAEELWRKGRVFRSGFGQFTPPSLFRFLPKNPGKRSPALGHLRNGNPLSPLVVRHGDAVYTSAALNLHRDLYHVANREVDIYVQEDARFAIVVPHAFPDRAYPVAIAGRYAETPHTIEMRLLTNRYAKRVTTQHRASVANTMAGVVGALASQKTNDRAFQYFMGGLLNFLGRAGTGNLTYIDLSEEDRERLLLEAKDIMKGEGYDPDEDEPTIEVAPASALDQLPAAGPDAATPGMTSDEFGIINRQRYK